MVMTLGVAALMAALSAGTARAASISCPNGAWGECYGTQNGDAMFGSDAETDNMYGCGGADLMYGYGADDNLYGGNESGWGDKIRGGAANDRVLGQGGDDALYGDNGSDRVFGGPGGDLIVGGYDRDLLKGGPGSDQINAQDGRTDTIDCDNEYDKVYYDKGLDVLRECTSTSQSGALMSASASGDSSESNLSTEKPPVQLFKHTGEVLVDHKGSEQCVSEKQVKAHAKHGDEIANPAGCSS